MKLSKGGKVDSDHADDGASKPFQRISSHVPGLDLVLQGGIFQGGIYMVVGSPGAGKTILANQFAFSYAAAGGRVLYITLLSESHARLFASLKEMDFFVPERLGTSIFYISGYAALEAGKLAGLLKLLRKAVRDHQATLLVIDGLVTAGAIAGTDLELRKFIHGLQVLVELLGCTTLLLSGATNAESNYAERTMVDGLIHLSTSRVGMRSERELEVLKLRGSAAIRGGHFFEISNAGITVHPRTEARLGTNGVAQNKRMRIAFGVPRLDEMLAGGLFTGSTTLLLGTHGSGKTSFGVHFLSAGADKKEPGLYFGFSEVRSRILSKSKRISPDLADHVKRGLIEVIWQPPLEQLADALVEKLIAAINRRKVRRVFIDGLGGFQESLIYPERLLAFFTALTNELRSVGVTTIVSDETSDFVGPQINLPRISAAAENVICLRHVELRSQLRRLVSVIKMREGNYDSSLREFSITDQGIELASTFESAEGILSGMARLRRFDDFKPSPSPTSNPVPRRKRRER